MTTVAEAFHRFRSNLETSDAEDLAASRRQKRLRAQLEERLDIREDFLTGAYARHTKTKPLRDVDIMIVLTDRSALKEHPRRLLDAVTSILRPLYGQDRVWPDRRAVRVNFGVAVVNDVSSDEVVSFDVVPAFAEGDHYLIADDHLGEWIATNPRVHADLATVANKAFDEQWKPLVKMLKKFNDHHGKPVEPSFLIEVMAFQLLDGKWTGSHQMEVRQYMASAADQIGDRWRDPAGVGPDVNDVLLDDPVALGRARHALLNAEKLCTEAMRLDRVGRTGEALSLWQELFGPLFTKT